MFLFPHRAKDRCIILYHRVNSHFQREKEASPHLPYEDLIRENVITVVKYGPAESYGSVSLRYRWANCDVACDLLVATPSVVA
jgi:hypothetical protein